MPNRILSMNSANSLLRELLCMNSPRNSIQKIVDIITNILNKGFKMNSVGPTINKNNIKNTANLIFHSLNALIPLSSPNTRDKVAKIVINTINPICTIELEGISNKYSKPAFTC